MINLTSDVVNPYEFMNEQYANLEHIQNFYYIANNLSKKKTFIGCTPVRNSLVFSKNISICLNKEKSFTALFRCSKELRRFIYRLKKNGIRICGTLENYSGFVLP